MAGGRKQEPPSAPRYDWRFADAQGTPQQEWLGGALRTTPAAEVEKQGLQLEAMQIANDRARAKADALVRVNLGSGGSLTDVAGGESQLGVLRDMTDPFWSQRSAYQQQLSDLLKNPGELASSPMYQFAFDQGMQGVNRSLAAKGMLNSGNRLAELTKYGQGMASQQFMPMANLLSGLAGANTGNPAAAVNALTTMRGQNIDAATRLLG